MDTLPRRSTFAPLNNGAVGMTFCFLLREEHHLLFFGFWLIDDVPVVAVVPLVFLVEGMRLEISVSVSGFFFSHLDVTMRIYTC